jgi:hypothetical protein
MPSNLVHTATDEAAWNDAKQATKKQYPDLTEDQDRFWKITNHIYQNMKALDPLECYVEPGLVEQLVDQVQEQHLGKARAVQGDALCRALHGVWAQRRRSRRLLGLVR